MIDIDLFSAIPTKKHLSLNHIKVLVSLITLLLPIIFYFANHRLKSTDGSVEQEKIYKLVNSKNIEPQHINTKVNTINSKLLDKAEHDSDRDLHP